MKRCFVFFLFIFLHSHVGCADALVEEHPTVAVMDFATHEGASTYRIDLANAGSMVCDELIACLVEDGRFIVRDRALMQERIEKERLNTTGRIDAATAKRLGALLNVRYILYGDVVNVSDSRSGAKTDTYLGDVSVGTVKAHIVARFMNAETGELLMAAKGEGKSQSSLVKLNADANSSLFVGTKQISQESVANALYKAAADAVDILLARLYGETGTNGKSGKARRKELGMGIE